MVNPYEDPIALVPSRHDQWRDEFERERSRVLNVLEANDIDSHIRRIEHVGSTAVPDLAAKDIVDLDIVVEDGAVATVSATLETELGGTRYENSETWNPVFREADGQRFNDHVFAHSGDGWKVSVATVAVLSDRPELRTEYEQVKREIADETDELETYGKAKTEFLQAVLDVARTDAFDFEFDVPSDR
jgi:GrpB-like predicted nucleotidyltransferase (UPF0157 family)